MVDRDGETSFSEALGTSDSGTAVSGTADSGGVGVFGGVVLGVTLGPVGRGAVARGVAGFAAAGFAADERDAAVRGVVARGLARPPEFAWGAAGRRARGDAEADFTGNSESSPELGAADSPAGFSSGSNSTRQPYQRRPGRLRANWASHHELGT
jgi:hypothetical protein